MSEDQETPVRVAVVTGGGTGIGAAAALADDGWRVITCGRRTGPLETLAADHPELPPHPTAVDVTDEESVRRLFDETVEQWGRVDLLSNNAGMGGFGHDLDAIPLAEWQRVVDVNLAGTNLCIREAFRVMRAQRPQGGRISNNGSISAHTPRPRSIAYTATKHAVTGLTKSTALDGRPYAIACGQIDIGNAATDMTTVMSDGILQADGSIRAEPRMDVADIGRAVVYIAGLPLDANVATMTVMATAIPYIGRG